MRRFRETHGSLELLLDTITNTFGGVLFLAILVALLLQFSGTEFESSESKEPDLAELADLQDELTATRADLESLQRAAGAQAAMQATLNPSDLKTEFESVQRLKSQRSDLLDERLILLQQLSDGLAANAEIRSDLTRLDEGLGRAKTEIVQGKAALASEIKARTRTARLPVVRSTLKAEIALIMRYGRLYSVHRNEEGGEHRRLNMDDFVVLEEKVDQIRITPKPYAGVIVSEDHDFSTQLQQALDGSDRDAHYLAIGVWEDSFDRFVFLKNALVDLGFEYRLIPLEEESVILEGGGGRPLVQ